MLRKLWKQMRWSLRTQVVVVLFAGYLLVLWERREPWILAHHFSGPIRLRFDNVSPDESRVTVPGAMIRTLVSIEELKEGQWGEVLWSCDFEDLFFYDGGFESNDSIVALVKKPRGSLRPSDDALDYVRFTRRFPEWWWGHFYRPEVWLLPLWLGLIVWTIRKDRAVPK